MNDERKNRLPLILGILGSVVLHLIILYLQLNPSNRFPEKLAEDLRPIELTEAPPPPPTSTAKVAKKAAMPDKPEMAETEDAPNKEIDPNAKFLSDRNQVAEKQTRAESTDDFRKKAGSGLKNDAKKPQADNPQTGEPDQDTAKEKSEDLAKDESLKPELESGLTPSQLEVVEAQQLKTSKAKGTAGVKRDWKSLTMKDLGIGGDGGQTAATDDKLAHVDTGERTILSTREYRYFSYYHRIKELLRQYWKPNVESKLYHMFEKGRTVGDDEMVTRLIVMLDTTGNIQKISRLTSSGINELDDAAIEAFQRAAPFPNPPKGIVEQDGFVRITWEFILKTEAAPRIQFSNAGNGRMPR
jgi:TonB family protein